ncbi:MAG: ArsR/SmtB family transcription factor [Planctomycetota bacterium]|jgi:DNA-binding transcriptional ArsR family regulator
MSKRPGDASGTTQPCPEVDEALNTSFFRALCDPSRIGLLVRLAKACEPQTVSRIAGCCPCDLSVVSRHLAMLRDAGILDAEKRGKKVFYSVRFKEVISTLRTMADALEACCPGDDPCQRARDQKRKEKRR